jgi:hypothetical protein
MSDQLRAWLAANADWPYDELEWGEENPDGIVRMNPAHVGWRYRGLRIEFGASFWVAAGNHRPEIWFYRLGILAGTAPLPHFGYQGSRFDVQSLETHTAELITSWGISVPELAALAPGEQWRVTRTESWQLRQPKTPYAYWHLEDGAHGQRRAHLEAAVDRFIAAAAREFRESRAGGTFGATSGTVYRLTTGLRTEAAPWVPRAPDSPAPPLRIVRRAARLP